MCIEILGGGHNVVRAGGEIDISNVGRLESAIAQALAHSPNGFIIDLSDVGYIDSTGIAAIMSAYHQISPSGRLVLVTTNQNVKSTLALIHTERLPCLFILDDMESAERALAAPF